MAPNLVPLTTYLARFSVAEEPHVSPEVCNTVKNYTYFFLYHLRRHCQYAMIRSSENIV